MRLSSTSVQFVNRRVCGFVAKRLTQQFLRPVE
jgi:hypothetical protein